MQEGNICIFQSSLMCEVVPAAIQALICIHEAFAIVETGTTEI